MNQELTARIKAIGGTEQRVWNRAADAEEDGKDGNILTFGEVCQA